MPWENIGDCGTGQIPRDRDWIIQCHEMAVSYLNFALPSVPAGCELGLMWHEHDVGDYLSVGIYWDFPRNDPPWDYIRKCEKILAHFDKAVNWALLEPHVLKEVLEMKDGEVADSDE